MAARRRPTSTDVEIQQLELKYGVRHTLAHGCVVVLSIAASAIPLLTIGHIVGPFAGKVTVVNVDLALTITVAVSIVVNGFQLVLGSRRKAEIKRLRERERELERRLDL